MEFGEMKWNTSNWSNFCMLLRRAGLTASAGLSCFLNAIRSGAFSQSGVMCWNLDEEKMSRAAAFITDCSREKRCDEWNAGECRIAVVQPWEDERRHQRLKKNRSRHSPTDSLQLMQYQVAGQYRFRDVRGLIQGVHNSSVDYLALHWINDWLLFCDVCLTAL